MTHTITTLDRHQQIALRRHRKVLLPEQEIPQQALLPVSFVATAMKNIEQLGFTLSPELFEHVQRLDEASFVAFYKQIHPILSGMVGAHQRLEPMYPNFPTQVMEASEAELYINAIMHYVGAAFGLRIMPVYEKTPRPPLADTLTLKPITLGSHANLTTTLTNLAGAKTSLSETDVEDLKALIELYSEQIIELLPETISHKENMSVLTATLVDLKLPALDLILSRYYTTATDILRLATALSGGDISLAENTKFKSFKRPQRRLLLALLERINHPLEDMYRYQRRWVRLGERLHPGEMRKRYPCAAKAFDAVRHNQPINTFNGQIESLLAASDVIAAVEMLMTRPGEFARRLDHLLRLDSSENAQAAVTTAFAKVSAKVATPVLLQVHTHFLHRNDKTLKRTFFPKGSVAKLVSISNTLKPLEPVRCLEIVRSCEEALVERFQDLKPLGRVYIDEQLHNHFIPFSQRSASKALNTLVRGSKVSVDQGDTIRLFLWWKEGKIDAQTTASDVDIDLTGVFYTQEWTYKEHISYTNLRSEQLNAVHSGDITSAPNGACEFIDIHIPTAQAQEVRYVVMNVYAYSSHALCDLPECYAGWMMRQDPNSGEIFEPATVSNKIDLSANTRICLPVIFDLQTREIIWADIALARNANYSNDIESNQRGVAMMGHAITTLKKPTLHTLFTLHANARASELVATPEEADVTFGLRDSTITPFDIEQIMSVFM